MKIFLTICLLLVFVPTIASAQQRISLTRAETREAERRLSDLGYWTGAIDDVFDTASQSALTAFQKWEGRPITDQLTLAELEAIRTSASPIAKDVGYAHVEVDLDRQVLMFVDEEGSVLVLPVSTGNGKPFIDEVRRASPTRGAAGSSFTPKKWAGRQVHWDLLTTLISSAAAWRFTEAATSPSSRRVMVVFGCQCSPLVR